jgi:ABC-type transport system involved in multi-copper enzyme maturation permease subunit
MRGSKAYWMLFAYLVVLSFALVMAYLFWWKGNRVSGESFVVGRVFFQTLYYVQLGLVCLIAPGLTAGAITIEKEQRTYDLLAVTPMKARTMVIGKLISAISFVLLLTISSLPLVSVCFLLGGVSPSEVFFAYLALLLTAFVYGSLGLMWSSVARNTATATVMTCGTALIIFLGTGIFSAGEALRAVNPAGALAYAMEMEDYFLFSLPAWLPSLILNGLAGTLFLMVSTRKIDSYETDKSVGLRIMSLLLYSAIIFFTFGWLFANHRSGFETGSELLLTSMFIVLTLLLILTPIFTSGEPDKEGIKRLRMPIFRGWTGLFRGRLDSGMPFLLLLWAVSIGLFLAGYLLMNQRIPTEIGLLLLVSAFLVLVVVIALGGIGLLLSCALRSRWAALASGYLIIAILILLPLIVLPISMGPEVTSGFKPALLPLYLNPHMALMSLFQDVVQDLPDPTGDIIPFFFVTTVIYMLIAALVLVKLRRVAIQHPNR